MSLIPYVDLPVGVEFVPSDSMTSGEKAENPPHKSVGGFLRKHERPLREVFPLAWEKMSEDQQAKWKALPNFDADKFFEITGVDVRESRHIVQVRTVDGNVVRVYADDVEEADDAE